jgi:SAM-dependent methyltransferase
VPLLRQRGARNNRALDLGCGIGRHAQLLAAEGFQCVGVDASEAGLAHARQQAELAGLAIDYRRGSFYELPFLQDQSVGLVVVWNVLYHGDAGIARAATQEIRRVLTPGGLVVGTMLSKRNAQFGQGREVSPDTFVVDDDPYDKAHPHFYCDTRTLLDLFSGFEVLELHDREQKPGAYHWEFVLEG